MHLTFRGRKVANEMAMKIFLSFFHVKCLGVKNWPNVYDTLQIPKVPFIKQHWRIQCTPKGFFHYDKRIPHCILGDSKVICLTLWLINIVSLRSFFTPALIIKRTKHGKKIHNFPEALGMKGYNYLNWSHKVPPL